MQLTIDRQLIENQIATSRAVLENRQLALAAGKASAQTAIINYHLHKRIIALSEHMEPINTLRNDTVYRNTIRKGLIECEELYWYGKNFSNYLAARNETQAIREVKQKVTELPWLLEEVDEASLRAEATLAGELEVESIESATLQPFEEINFTIHWDPVTIEFIDANWTGGAGKILSSVLNFGGKVVDDEAGVVNNVVDKGVDVIEHTKDKVSGFFSKPIQMIIIIVGSIIGIIMVLVFGSCAWRYAKTGKTPNPDKA